MRCKYCNVKLEQQDYRWDSDIKEFVEQGKHRDGNCVGGPVADDYDQAWVVEVPKNTATNEEDDSDVV